jgi:8-hydroxy-5-deazaflavin:NADPH oxidoreductase
MKIAILGSGNMGGGLGKLWAKAGHQVIFSYSRDESKLKNLAISAGENAKTGTLEEAIQQSEVIMLAVWLPAIAEVMQAAGALDGKIVITCVSGLEPDFSGQRMGMPTELKISVAETVQQLAPKAKVIEAFNMTFAEIIGSDSRQFGADRPSIFYCGEDDDAKKVVSELVEDCGYEAIDVGKLIVARHLEMLATAWVQFAVASQLFPNLGLKALRR